MVPDPIYTRPIWLDSDQQTLKVIDQRLLPHTVSVLKLKTADDVIMAIRDMVVRGAPLIGVTAAYGVYLAVMNSKSQDDPKKYLIQECHRIKSSRPTAVNLFWAVDRMLEKFPDADIVFIESGGDNLAATFSPELSDLTIYVIDVAAGEKIPRKGGPGITKSDLFVINKTDLAPYVGANLDIMAADTTRMRQTPQGLRPFVMTNLKTQAGLSEVIGFIETKGMLKA